MDVVAWLLDSDPALRWQVLRDLRVLRWWDGDQPTPGQAAS